MKTCVAAVCGMFMLLVSCSGSREFKPAFNQPLQPVMQPGFVYVDQVAPLVKTNLKYAGYDNFVGRPLDGYHGRRAILRTQAAQALKKVSEDLYRQGYLLEIYDAYRPHTAVLDICKWGTDDGDQKMKSRYYPHIDKAKVFGDHYVRDFRNIPGAWLWMFPCCTPRPESRWIWAAIMTCWIPVPPQTPH